MGERAAVMRESAEGLGRGAAGLRWRGVEFLSGPCCGILAPAPAAALREPPPPALAWPHAPPKYAVEAILIRRIRAATVRERSARIV